MLLQNKCIPGSVDVSDHYSTTQAGLSVQDTCTDCISHGLGYRTQAQHRLGFVGARHEHRLYLSWSGLQDSSTTQTEVYWCKTQAQIVSLMVWITGL